ncbi:outer membrane protein [Pseudotabrizicola sp. L79]|uniref:outer membrane protein n=1 Tax=Pseudotabrizicola sp. L79 TaxID=3118402 RepID=UPI002F9288D1
MKRNIAAVMTLASGLVAAQGAWAGGPIEVAPEPMVEAAPVPMVAPSGEWTGGYVGAQLGYGDLGSAGTAFDGDGAIGGVHAGYRFDYGQIVAGAEVSYDSANIDLGTAGDSLDDVAKLNVTLGYDLGNTLVYGAAGLARASATVGGVDVSDNGYYLGLGAEYALTDQWSVGGELGNHHFSNFGGTGSDIDATTAQAKINFRF